MHRVLQGQLQRDRESRQVSFTAGGRAVAQTTVRSGREAGKNTSGTFQAGKRFFSRLAFSFARRNLPGSLLILPCGWGRGGGGAANLDLGILLLLRRYSQTRSPELRQPGLVFGSCK